MQAPALRGGLLALLAAVLFGISTPLVQWFGRGLGPFSTAALLYAGAAAAALFMRPGGQHETALRRSDLGRLLAVAVAGAVVAPVALAWGLQRASGVAASLLLTLEVVFTVLMARWLYREDTGPRVVAAIALLMCGAGLLVIDQGRWAGAQAAGLLAVGVATAAWGLDSTLSRTLAERNPAQVVLAKALLGSAATGALAWMLQEPWPAAPALAGLLAVGATGYGFSLRYYLLAQRAFGAARTASVFASAPFVGALLALALGERAGTPALAAAGALMALGLWLHLSERHSHLHAHDALQHEHMHDHAEEHHQHTHNPAPTGPHSHPHQHEAMRHDHPHVPDAHHQHGH